MSGFRSVSEIVTAIDAGRHHITTWRKTPSSATTQGLWSDFSMVPGNPNPNYYASSPAVAATLSRSANAGINHGPNPPSGMSKFLFKSTLLQGLSNNGVLPVAMLCDYLLYYPFVDSSDGTDQPMDNTVGLSRYADGEGVRILPVTVAPFGGYFQFYCTYTNQDGVAGRVTPTVRGSSGATTNGIIPNATSNNLSSPSFAGPFLPLQAGDTGVRSIESVTFPVTEVGLLAFVLVKPLANASCINGIDAPVERTFPVDFPIMPKIEDDAYLNHIVCVGGSSVAQPYHGLMEFIWN